MDFDSGAGRERRKKNPAPGEGGGWIDRGIRDRSAAEGDVATALDGVEVPDVPYEEMTVEQLQAAILAKMAANGPVTDQMRRDVEQNVWQDSLVNWVKSFR